MSLSIINRTNPTESNAELISNNTTGCSLNHIINMFRRNKKAKQIDDDDSVIPLTGPDTLSSSSSAEISKAKGGGMGGRMLGMGKKKNAIVNDKSGNASGVKILQNSGGIDKIIKPAQAPVIMQQSSAPESKPVSHKRKELSSQVPTNSSALSPPQQRISSQTTASTKSIETRETNDVNSRSSNPPLVSKLSSNNNEKTVTAVSKKALLTGPATSSFAPAIAKPPTLIINGGGKQQSSVPLTRSGWSMQSNGSSAMNSESYIKSLDNVPPLHYGKVSFFAIISIFCTTD